MMHCNRRRIVPSRPSVSAKTVLRHANYTNIPSLVDLKTNTKTKRQSISYVSKESKKAAVCRSSYGDGPVREHVEVRSKQVASDPPEIPMTCSSSSASSQSSATTTVEGTESINQSFFHDSPIPSPQYSLGHFTYDPSYGYLATGQPMGMMLASPRTPRTPPQTQGSTRSIARGIVSPPKLYRASARSINCRESIDWTPFIIDSRFPDEQLQIQQEQEHLLHQQQLHHSRLHPASYCPNYLSRPYPGPAGYHLPPPPPPESYILSGYRCQPEVIGHPSLRIYKLRLPSNHVKLLDRIIEGCEAYASRRPSGWRTDLYSLTQQDIALLDVPGMTDLAMPIMQYLCSCICEIYHAGSVKVDRNQPHVLKYNEDHTGVELHHDRCDVTANLMMSRSHTYVGGGTYIPDANKVIRLKYGEFLLHPGQLVHGGLNITKGTRYLMVLFAHLK